MQRAVAVGHKGPAFELVPGARAASPQASDASPGQELQQLLQMPHSLTGFNLNCRMTDCVLCTLTLRLPYPKVFQPPSHPATQPPSHPATQPGVPHPPAASALKAPAGYCPVSRSSGTYPEAALRWGGLSPYLASLAVMDILVPPAALTCRAAPTPRPRCTGAAPPPCGWVQSSWCCQHAAPAR